MVKGYEIEETTSGAGYPSQGEKTVKGYDFSAPARQKPVALRGWEYKFATGKGLRDDEDEGPWGGWGQQEPPSIEQRANIYAGARTVAEILPYARYAFASGRDAWARKSTLGQTGELIIEALTLLPPVLIGKGLFLLAKGSGKTATLPFRVTRKFALKRRVGKLLEQDPFLDIATTQVKKYERLSAGRKAIKKYGINEDEAISLLKGDPLIWEGGARSGAVWQSKGSKEFQKLFKKDGFIKSDVKKQLTRWSRPQDTQELGHYIAEWKKLTKKHFGEEYDSVNIFKMQATKLFGERGAKLTAGDIDSNTMGFLIRDLLEENPAKLLKRMDVGYGHKMPTIFLPARKVHGFGERVWRTYSKIYLPLKEMFTNSNIYGTIMTSKFHATLASRGLGILGSSKLGGVAGLKRAYSKREWEAAGELVTSMDNAVGKGFRQEEVQALLDSVPNLKVRQIAKSWFDFSDTLYNDYLQKKIPMIFEEIGLTEKGRNGLKLLMSDPNGIERYMDVAFSRSANLAFDSKARVVQGMLKKAQTALRKNSDWFTDKPLAALAKVERQELRERMLKGLEELLPMKKGSKKGFVGYLDKYVPRMRNKQFAQSSDRFDKLAKSRKSGFTKGRMREFAEEGQLKDLTRIVESRITMQAKELYVYKPMEKVIEHASKLPRKFKDFSEHHISRQLGETSGADIAVAQWLTGNVGTMIGKVFDERSVAQLAHTINDLVYMGGLGFKPFSAMRNYFQPLLMVPADMGGVKDFYWLGKGYASAFKKETRDFIKSIGAIQEFAPDLYLRPRVVGFGGSFTVGGKKFDLPSTQRMRDLALWMFKNSDRHNRYVTGGAAIEKWNYFASKYLNKSLGPKEMKQFAKKVNINSREEWVRAQINEHLRTGTAEGLEEAKKLWVYDVIADTQYLYGTLDAPIYSQKYGSVGKMAGIFQSWWMNYGAALEKWALRTPEAAPIVNGRIMTWMLAGAIVEETTAGIWGRRTASKMTALGPFPMTVNEFLIPPTFAPVYYGARTLAHGIDGLRHQDSTEFKRSLKGLLKSSQMFVPGGLQMGQFYRGAKKEGWEGFSKAIIKYDPEKDED